MKTEAEKIDSELSSLKEKHRIKLSRLRIISKRLKNKLLDDKDAIADRKKLYEKGSNAKEIKIKFPKKEELFAKKDLSLIEEVISLTKKSIGKEGLLKSDSKVLNLRILDKKELPIESGVADRFQFILKGIDEKFSLIKKQEELLKKGSFKELLKLADEELKINDNIINVINEIFGLELKESAIEKGKNEFLPRPSHARRNAIIIVIIIALAVSPFFSHLFSQESVPAVSDSLFKILPPSELIAITSENISAIRSFSVSPKAKADFINSLIQLYYYSRDKCSVKTCVLDKSAIEGLLTGNIKSAALSATEISLRDNILKINSEKTLSAPVPGSAGTATIYLEDSSWSVSEKDGTIEFNIISGKAWLTINLLVGFGNMFMGDKNKIVEIKDIKKAELYKYYRSDGKIGIYGAIYGDKDSQDGIDLFKEEFSTINIFPAKTITVAFAGH